MKKMLISSTPLIFKRRKNSCYKLALTITPASNNSRTNVRNVVKICFQAIREMKFTIPLKNFEVCIVKIKIR